LGRHNDPVPNGGRGELCVEIYEPHSGPKQNKAIPSVATQLGSEWFRTGYLARVSADGALNLCGPVHTFVVVRGLQVNHQQIEAELLLHPAIEKAAVMPQREASGKHSIVAYIWVRPGTTVSYWELRRHLHGHLLCHGLPVAFVEMPNFKVDGFGGTMEPVVPDAGLGTLLCAPYALPQTPVEKSLTALWRDVLGVEHVGMHDDFFDLGGNSMQVLQMLSQIRNITGWQVSLRSFLEFPTLQFLATQIGTQEDSFVDFVKRSDLEK